MEEGPPKRPGLGTVGRQISLRSNFLPLESLPSGVVSAYELVISPSVPVAKNRQIYQIWEDECFSSGSLGSVRPVYDGRKLLFAPRPIPMLEPSATINQQDPAQEYIFLIDYYEDGLNGLKDNQALDKSPPRKYQLAIKKQSDIDMDALPSYLVGNVKEVPAEAINVIDVLLRHRPSLMYTTIGRCFYTQDTAMSIAQGVELWQGFHQSVKPASGAMLLNLDVSASAFYQPGPLIDLIVQILGPQCLRGSMSERDRLKVERIIKDLKVQVTHRGPYRKKFKILKLTQSSADRTLFLTNLDGTEESVSRYFASKYDRHLDFGHLPCVVAGDSSRPVYLPLEVCKIVPAQRYMRKLNEKQTSDMIKFTCQPPHIRSNKISAGVTILQQSDNEYLQDFGVSFSQEMVALEARILPPPVISYHPASRDANFTPIEGTWNLKDKRLTQGVTLYSWSILVFSTETDCPLATVQSFVTHLVSIFDDCGLSVENQKPPISYANPYGDIERIMTDAYVMAGASYQSRPQLVLCILPNTGVPLYAEIKRVSDTVLGIPTQCIQAKHIYAAKRQYCANVCLKVNVKLGGMNGFLSHSELPFLGEKPTILLGADVTHPAPGSSSSTSIASVVGSIDAQASRYASAIRTQKGRQELIFDLTAMTMELLKTFHQSTAVKPERIVMYRDGVSEYQLYDIGNKEVKAIKDACEALEPGYCPSITYIVVHKRHHARFIPIRKEDADKSGNVLPGTVIETGVTHPFEFDFYIASHPGLQGTSKPTHYHVIHDENQFTADTLQSFTYRLCFLYCRATRSVSVCPPAYYAHLVATRARFHATGEGWSDDHQEMGVVAQAMKRGLRTSPSGYFGELGMGRILSYGAVKSELKSSMYFI